jgi:hypothetical protein
MSSRNRAMRETKRFESGIERALRGYYEEFRQFQVEVKRQWPALQGESRDKYSPRVDVAVGPFATGILRFETEYDQLAGYSSREIDALIVAYRENLDDQDIELAVPSGWRELNKANRNARCFVAVEIERSGTRKHMLGDVVNACSLGRVGMIVPWDGESMLAFLRIAKYFGFLGDKEKPTYYTRNLVICSWNQFATIFGERHARS